MNRRRRPVLGFAGQLIAGLLLLVTLSAPAGATEVRIGVLALRGQDKVQEMWSETARYLERVLPGYRFEMIALDFDQVRLAVRQASIDFVLTNPSYHVELEMLYGVSAIATLKNRSNGGAGHSTLGSVIFARADSADIRTLTDLRRKRIAAVNQSGFGGWQAGWREIERAGLKIERDVKGPRFEGTHDAVVYAVRDRHADAGVVRTSTLERMHKEGLISFDEFYVLNRRDVDGFPEALSTALYPEWPMAKLRQVPEDLAIQVAIALMRMSPDEPAARTAMITGWTLPLNYQPVHEALRELRIGPYEHLRQFTFSEVLSRYGHWFFVAIFGTTLGLFMLVYIGRMNRRLHSKQTLLRELNTTLEDKVRARTEEVNGLLDREHFLRGVVEMVADVNQILITSTSRDEMLKACCDRLIAHPAYRFAWVGVLRDGELDIAARSYGPAEMMRGVAACLVKGPTQEVIAHNRTVIETEPAAVSDDLMRSGVRAIVALPLRQDVYSEPVGTLSVLTGREEGFDREELDMLEQLAGDIGFAIHAFRQQEETQRLQQERINNYEETILAMVDMIESRDTYTAGHTRRVAHYCELIATRLGLSPEEIEKLKRSAVLHDIGKIAIPDAVLLKPGQLSPVEYQLIMQHAEEGYQTLASIEMYKELADIMRAHHEREDGSGYPQGLVSGQIPRMAQIMAVADSFDAMTTNRIYKPRKEVQVALDELQQLAGVHYASDVVEAACEVLREVEPPPISDQLPKTPLERQRFAYFFNDPLTGTYNANYLQFMLHNGLPTHLKHAYLVLLNGFSSVNLSGGWLTGNQALAGFATILLAQVTDALVFRVMGDDFVILSDREHLLDGASLKDHSPLKGTSVAVEVRELDVHGADRSYLEHIIRQAVDVVDVPSPVIA